MQECITRSQSDSSRSSDLASGSESSRSGTVSKSRQVSWLKLPNSILIVLSTVVFGTMIVCSELIVTNFRVLASEPSNAPLDNVLLDFTAKWCGPCQQMSPVISRLERQNFPIRKVDIDVEKSLARQFNIDSIPCFVLVVNGREVNRITGATDEKELRRLLAMLPRQNIDDSMLAQNGKQSKQQNSAAGSSGKNSDEKKSFLRIPPLFPKNQDKDRDNEFALTSTSESDTFRGQSPNQDTSADGYARDPMLVSIRIRVTDGSRVHYGSGTMIESQPGRSVVLTCGHIFRDLSKDAMIEADLFIEGSSKPHTLVAQVLRHDLKSDLGLITLPTKNQLPVIHLSALQSAPVVKNRVVSVGCGGGERPTREEHQITGINKYLGPDNIECDGVPQQGRSGGGLFHRSELIGVCIAADPKEKRGIYTSMKPIALLLEKAQMGYLVPTYQTKENPPVEVAAQTQEPTLGSPAGLIEETPQRVDDEIAGIVEAATRSGAIQTASSGDYVGAEIVCIVRPKKPGAPTRVVVVNQATPRFVNDLLHEPGSSSRNDVASVSQTAPSKKSADKQSLSKSTASRTAKPVKTPAFDDFDSNDSDGPIETSFESKNNRRSRN